MVRLYPFLLLLFFASAQACELGVYTYDSIAGRGGLGPVIFPEFEKLTGCKVRIIASGDAVQVLSRVEIDLKRGKPPADVILGVDALNWDRARKVSDPGFALEAENLKQVDPAIQKYLPELPGFLPIDFGAMTFMMDSSSVTRAPDSIEDLLKGYWKKRFILEDPRTSSPGLQFLLFTKQVLGKKFGDFWFQLKAQRLAMPPGWDTAYGLFLKGEAPLVWSYVTSEAYHREHGSTRYRAVLLRDGQPLQIEGALIVRGASNPELARRFLNFLFSDWVQARIATTNWMWPAKKTGVLPGSFASLPRIARPLFLSGVDSASVLKEWSEAIHR